MECTYSILTRVADELFDGNFESACNWATKPCPLLGDEKPINLIEKNQAARLDTLIREMKEKDITPRFC